MSSLRFVPYAVQMRRAGFVPTHTKSWSIYSPKWIQAPPPSPAVDMAAVDRVINKLTRFVAKWVTHSRALRRQESIRAAGDKWRNAVMADSWFAISEAADRREAARRRRQFNQWCAMPEVEWKAAGRTMVADAPDIWPVIRDILRPVWEERDRRGRDRAQVAVETAQVWNEIQRPRVSAPRVSRSRFSALADSDSD